MDGDVRLFPSVAFARVANAHPIIEMQFPEYYEVRGGFTEMLHVLQTPQQTAAYHG